MDFMQLLKQVALLPERSLGGGLEIVGICFVLLLGMVCAFFGRNVIKVLGGLTGGMIGLYSGLQAAKLMELGSPLKWVIAGVLALAFSILCFLIERFGAFVAVSFLSYLVIAQILLSYTKAPENPVLLGSLGGALALGLIAAIFIKKGVIILTSFCGAMLFSGKLFSSVVLIREDRKYQLVFQIMIMLIVAVIGLVIQLRDEKNSGEG